jgi:hypothetical protein
MRISLRQLDREMQGLVQSHVQVDSYFWGDWSDSFEGRVQQYPAVVVNVPSGVSFFEKTTELQLNVICVAQVTKGQENLKEVESDTLQILRDIYQALRFGENWNAYAIVKNASAPIKFKDTSPDEVAGWQMTLDLKLIDASQLCDLPFENYNFTKKLIC